MFPLAGANTRWNVALLPFVEQRQRYRQFDMSQGPDWPGNVEAAVDWIDVLTCPSEGRLTEEGGPRPAAHFAANILVLESSSASCTDGVSHTALLTELRSANRFPWSRGPVIHLTAQDSAHGSSVNILFVDGHVETVDGRNEHLMRSIGTPSDFD
jgi:prepilin-type processing-associated H-X9-DG protein